MTESIFGNMLRKEYSSYGKLQAILNLKSSFNWGTDGTEAIKGLEVCKLEFRNSNRKKDCQSNAQSTCLPFRMVPDWGTLSFYVASNG